MFDSLSDQIKQDDAKVEKRSEVYLRWALVAVLSLVLFVGLYAAILHLG